MEKNNDDENSYYLYFEITDINIIKNIFESLAPNIEICRLIISKNKSQSELEISGVNSTRTFYFKSKFNDKLIKNCVYENDKIEIELISTDMVNILKSYDSTDNLLLFYIYNNNKKNICVEFKHIDIDNSNSETESDSETENQKKKKCVKKTKKIKRTKNTKNIIKEKKFSFNVGHPIYPEKQIAKINFDKKVFLDVNRFYKICKDMNILFKYIKISSKNNKSLCFTYDSNKCDGLVKLNYDESNVILENLTNLKSNNIGGVYCIEDIVGFSKLCEITSSYHFMIKNNYFLESIHKIGEYGNILITYIPLKEDIVKNSISYNDSDNSDNLSCLSNDGLLESEQITKSKKNKKTINDKILYVEIDKIELFKNLCECIEKIVPEPIFKFNTTDDLMEIKIICSSGSKNINIGIQITNIFGRYKKLDKIINLGIGLKHLNDILKTVDKTDKIVLSIDPEDKHNLTIQIKTINNSDNDIELRRIYKVKLLNVEDTELTSLTVLSPNHQCKILIESNEFYKICKDINTIGEEIKIYYDNKNLIFSSMCECKYINIIKKDNNLINVEDKNKDKLDNNEIQNNKKIINEFEIKDIMIFNKISSYMEKFNINLSSDGRFVVNSNFIESSGSITIQYLSKNMCDISPNDKNMIKTDVDKMEDKLLFFKLKKINFMKNIIDTLDKMVSDVEWVFTSNENISSNSSDNEKTFVGLEITCTDPSKTLYVKTKLTNELFKSYYCEKKIFKFGMNLEFFNKILKMTEKNDIAIYCYIEKNDPSNLIVRFKNPEKENKKIFKIPLQIISVKKENTQLSLGFEKKISLKADSLFSKCKMISNNSQFVKIVCDGEKIQFKCVGDKEGIITLDSTDDSTLDIINLDENTVECIYEIKNILMFSRLASITEEFSFYMKNNFALTSIFNFGECGSISVILSPVNEEHISNQDYDYSDDEEDIELLNTNSNILDLY
jgi:hypothetical protein